MKPLTMKVRIVEHIPGKALTAIGYFPALLTELSLYAYNTGNREFSVMYEDGHGLYHRGEFLASIKPSQTLLKHAADRFGLKPTDFTFRG